MAEEHCKVCGKPVKPLPYTCSYCGEVFCVEHRLPEKHGCAGLSRLRSFEVEVEGLDEAILEFEEAARRRRGGLLGKLKEKLKRGK